MVIDDSMAFFYAWIVKILRNFIILVLAIIAIILLFKIKVVFTYIDSINISYYINKYDLMSVVSGIIAGLITFASMLYIDNLNRKRWLADEFARKEVESKIKYCDLLDKLVEKLRTLPAEYNGATFYRNGSPEKYLNDILDICNELENLYNKMYVYTNIIFRDKYIETLYLFRYIGKAFRICIEGLYNGATIVDVNMKDEYDSFTILNFIEIFERATGKPYKKVMNNLTKELFKLRKIYTSHK